jgi:hypothetical protein
MLPHTYLAMANALTCVARAAVATFTLGSEIMLQLADNEYVTL